ncbi:MAG: peptide ABC transporter permease [Bdellovibrionaceae bacterium]|nr:peptide ABC transporter permease [Pseudobdellovibrionaceae bacterium]
MIEPNSDALPAASPNSLWTDAFRRLKKDKVGMISLIVIVIYVLVAILCGLDLIFQNYSVADDARSYLAPNAINWFGTDFLGRDVLARAAHGTYTSMLVGLLGPGLSVIIGVVLGALAGYFGGRTDALVVWFYTTVDTIPYILLISAFAFVLGPGLQTLCIVFGLTGWVGLCRLVRAEFLKHKEKEYVQSARALGAGHMRRIFRHILPNVLHIVLIQFSLAFVSVIKAEVILSYLGLGVEAGTPSWGVMISDAKLELSRGVWWGLLTATLFMFFLVLALNLFTSALRDALDPKLKGK